MSGRGQSEDLRLLDSITVTGLRVFAHHGVFDFERENGQDFVLDLTVWLAERTVGGERELGGTVHYGELSERVAAAVERDPVDLIETLAERVAGVALGFEHTYAVEVTVHKPQAPIPVPFQDVSVRILRWRG